MIHSTPLESNPNVTIHQNQPTHPRYGLFIIHGMGEHGLRYQRFMDVLEKQNILACTMDLRGHGQSLSPSQEVGILRKEDNFESILNDINRWTQDVKSNYPDVTFTFMGHSMGSIFARRYASLYPQSFDRMIWMGTLPYFGPLKIKAIKILTAIISAFYPVKKRNQILSGLLNHPLKKHFPGAEFNWLSQNEDNVRSYDNDPLSGYVYNSYFYRFFFKLIEAVNREATIKATQLSSVYVIAGVHDPVIESEVALKSLLKRYQEIHSALNVSYYFVPNARHEVLHEGYQEVDDWLIEVIKHER
jgi:alpha-beta hydrolase superfamily lysophospholipase